MLNTLKSFITMSFLIILIFTATVAKGASGVMLTMFCEGATTRAACLVTEPDGIKSLGEALDSGETFNNIADSKHVWKENSKSEDNVSGEYHLLNLFLKKQGSYNLTITAKELTSVVAAFNLVKWTDADGKERWLSKTGAAGGDAKAVFNIRHNKSGKYLISVTRVSSKDGLIKDITALTTLGWIEDKDVSTNLKSVAESFGGTAEDKKDCLIKLMSLIRESYGEGVNHRAVTVLTEDINYMIKRL